MSAKSPLFRSGDAGTDRPRRRDGEDAERRADAKNRRQVITYRENV